MMGRTAVVVMGVAGSGKTTVSEILAERLHWKAAEADDFHSAENVAKMHAATPLTDEDRQPWLVAIRDWISAADTSVLVTCSALRRSYRDVLRQAAARVVFLHLAGSADLIGDRMRARVDHFMPPELLQSQLETLEPLQPDEEGVVINVDTSPEQIADRAVAALGLEASGG